MRTKPARRLIAGTFNSWAFSRRPVVQQVSHPDGTQSQVIRGGVQAGSPFAYLSLTDVCDGTKLLLQFVNLTKNAVLFGTELTLANSNRLAMLEAGTSAAEPAHCRSRNIRVGSTMRRGYCRLRGGLLESIWT